MKPITLIAIIAASTMGHADTGVAYVFEPRTKAAYEVVTTQIGEVVKPLGLRKNLSVNAFAGFGDKDRPLAGFSLSYRLNLAQNVSLDAGPAVFVSDRKPSGIAVYVGLTWRF
jgi:hypothetical protein